MSGSVRSRWEAAYENILPLVQKPSRYLGTETGRAIKDPQSVRLRFALAFPEVYEIGQSYPGLQILYDVLNRRHDTYAERVFAPWLDLEKQLRAAGLPLVSLETFTPLAEFHIVGFTLQYELTYTNLLCMLELGGIPLRSAERSDHHPLVLAGGPCAFNPEPLAEFLDAVLLGDGEEAVHEICDAYLEASRTGRRIDVLDALASVRGVYVPAFYRPVYSQRGELVRTEPVRHSAPDRVRKRVVADLDSIPVRQTFIVPTAQVVHDRPAIEVMRGCVKGCRFCQAGYIYRPLRERNPQRVLHEAVLAAKRTGQEELSLLSLSTGDYSCINPVLAELMNRLQKDQVAVSLPSTRVDALAPQLLEQIRRVRKTGFTLAPEAGSQRLRDLIQKEYQETELIEAAELIFSLGWRHLKLYFMIGLPTETEEDLDAIVDLCARVRAVAPPGAEVVASVSNFVPKAHTPFQWLRQVDATELGRRQEFLRARLWQRGIVFRCHDVRLSALEGVFSRGNRRLANALEHAFRLGCRFDGWQDQCRFDLWSQAFAETGIDPDHELRRRRLDEPLPWDHLDSGVSKEFLHRELARAFEGTLTPDCSVQRCTYCGACDFKVIRNVDFHITGAKAAEHRGENIRTWASSVIGEPADSPAWEPRGWKKVHAPHLFAERSLSRTPRPRANQAQGYRDKQMPPQSPQPMGNAEEWLGAQGEHRLFPLTSETQGAEVVRARYRLRYQKVGRAKFLGSLEVTNAFYRALRLSRLPVTFSRGHHPLPRISFGPATPFGVESAAEYCEVFFSECVSNTRIPDAMNPHLPAGIHVTHAWLVPLRGPSLDSLIEGFAYDFDFAPINAVLDQETVQRRIQDVLSATELWFAVQNRNGTRARNLREQILSLQLDGSILRVRLRKTEQGTLRPTQLLTLCLGLTEAEARRVRIQKTETFFRPQWDEQSRSAITG